MNENETNWRKEKRKNDGSIKTINGKIYARIQYLDEATGKRKEKLKPAKNRTDARELIKEMRNELNNNGQASLESDKMTFEEVVTLYAQTKLIPPVYQNGLKIDGKRSYRHQLSLLNAIKLFFGKKPIRNIKASDLEAFKTKRLNTPVVVKTAVKKVNPKKERKKFLREIAETSRQRSIVSVNRELSLLREIFVFAENSEIITSNPFKKVKKLISLSAEISRERVLSRDEETQLLNACQNPSRLHLKPLIICATDTAMRKGELLKLVWQDVDLFNGIITVQATNAKTEKTRLIGMTRRVKDELAKLWDISPQQKELSVFGIKDNFSKSWNSAKKEANIDDLHFHDLRHTAITRMVRAGISSSEIMKISGHTQMKTFQRYVNLTNDSVTISANLLDNFNAKMTIKTQTESLSAMVN